MKNFISKIISFVRGEVFGKKDFIHGVIEDPKKLAASLPQFNEMVAKTDVVNWKPFDVSKLPNFPVRNQNGSSSCVAFTIALMCSIMYFTATGTWINFSPAFIYSRRKNKPNEGMLADDAFSLASDGMLPDEFMPSDDKSEEYMNTTPVPKLVTMFNKLSALFGFDHRMIALPVGDIETVASTIQRTGKPVMVWFRFGDNEWKQSPLLLTLLLKYHHSVTAIPPTNPNEQTFGIYEGEKAVAIQDSWGKIMFTFGGKRIIKESFWKARNTFAAYVKKLKFEEGTDDRPSYDGKTFISLQNVLRYEGLFPINQDFFEGYGPITIEAVKKFQVKYGIANVFNSGYGVLGPKTRTKLLELYP